MDPRERIEVFFGGKLPPDVLALKRFSIGIYTASSAASLGAFIYGLYVVNQQPALWRSSIFRVLLVAQVFNFMRCILRPISSYTHISAEFGCRAMLFLNNAVAMLPVNLCIYCVIYLQLVIVHKISPTKRWPRALLLTIGVMLSLVPISMYLFLSPSTAGVNSFCSLRKIPNHQQYVFIICCVAIWEYLPGIVGVLSIATLMAYIIRSRRKTRQLLGESRRYYGPAEIVRPTDSTEILSKTLCYVIWFPITPIISLWLNMLLLSVNYYTQRTFDALEYINVILLALQSFIIAIALVANPNVRYARAEQARERERAKAGLESARATNNMTSGSDELTMPPISVSLSPSLGNQSDTLLFL